MIDERRERVRIDSALAHYEDPLRDVTPVEPAPATTADEALSPDVPPSATPMPAPRAAMRPGPAAAQAGDDSSAETVEREGDGNQEPDQTPAADPPDEAEEDAPTGAI